MPKSDLPNHVCDVTICRVTFREVTVLADLIRSLIEKTADQRTISVRTLMFEPFLRFLPIRIGKLSLFPLLNSVAKMPNEHYQEHHIADDVDRGWNGVGADISAHTDPGLIGGLATRMQKNQVRRATGAPDFVLASRLALRLRSRPRIFAIRPEEWRWNRSTAIKRGCCHALAVQCIAGHEIDQTVAAMRAHNCKEVKSGLCNQKAIQHVQRYRCSSSRRPARRCVD
jgi:hypothetical protein